MNNKVKILIIAALVVILVAVLNLYTFLESSTTSDQPRITNNVSQPVKEKIIELYIDEETGFVREDITEEYVEELRAEIDDLNESTLDKNVLNRQLDEIVHRVDAKKAVNAFYPENTPAINADQVVENLTFKEGLTLETVEEVKEKYYFMTAAVQPVDADQTEEETEEVEALDQFQMAINAQIDYAVEGFGSYDIAKRALEEVKALTVEDGQISNIAQAMARFESALEDVELPAAKEELTKAAQAYVEDFVQAMLALTTSIPQYYELALTAVEPSQLLTAAMLENVALLNPVEESSEESSEEPVVEPEVTEPESNWTPPQESWTPPVVNPPVVDPPVVDPPVVDPPVVDPPVVDPPVVDPPVVDPPAEGETDLVL